MFTKIDYLKKKGGVYSVGKLSFHPIPTHWYLICTLSTSIVKQEVKIITEDKEGAFPQSLGGDCHMN